MPDDALTDEQRDRVIANMAIVTRYVQAKIRRSNPNRDDLEQAAVIGLMDAVRTHDPTEHELETHARLKMRDEINRFLQLKRLIYVPRHLAQAVKRGDMSVTYADDARRAMLVADSRYLESVPTWPSRNQRRIKDREVRFAKMTSLILAIDQLPEMDRDIIHRRFADNQTHKAIGAAHNRTREWARLRLVAIINQLRETMESMPNEQQP